MKTKIFSRKRICFVLTFFLFSALFAQAGKDEIRIFHSISSHRIFNYVKELASEKYYGRLTGTQGFTDAGKWAVSLLEKWGVEPGAGNGTFYQEFDIPYTLVLDSSFLCMHIPVSGGEIKKFYTYDDQFIPGSTSGTGEVTAEVVYAGYGITAPELGYDDYVGVDVKGKIVLIENEAPVSPDADFSVFRKWRPYTFHQYKLLNAVKHGAKGMIYNYGPIGNPNNAYAEGFVYSHVGKVVVKDVFEGTGKSHKELVAKIKKDLKPQSFATGKIMTIKNVTIHNKNGRGFNVIGKISGSDPEYQNQVILLGAHIDHLGRCPEIIPGANDNASGVAVILGAVKALTDYVKDHPLKRSVYIVFFGAEEQAIVGSKTFLADPPVDLKNIACFINLDGVGCGDKISVTAGENFPGLYGFFEKANNDYVHRIMKPSFYKNVARPRLDAARFLWAGVTSISFYTYGGVYYYHNTHDNLDIINPEIMEDLAGIIFLSIVDIDKKENLKFKHPEVLLSKKEISL